MIIVIGLLIGAALGVVQFFMLQAFTARVTAGEANVVALGLAQWVLPFAALIIVAFVYRDILLWTGIGMAGALTLASITKLLTGRRNKPQ